MIAKLLYLVLLVITFHVFMFIVVPYVTQRYSRASCRFNSWAFHRNFSLQLVSVLSHDRGKRQTSIHRYKHTHTHTRTGFYQLKLVWEVMQTDRQTHGRTDKLTDGRTDGRGKEGQKYRQSVLVNRQAGRQVGRQTDRQTDRQKDRSAYFFNHRSLIRVSHIFHSHFPSAPHPHASLEGVLTAKSCLFSPADHSSRTFLPSSCTSSSACTLAYQPIRCAAATQQEFWVIS